MARRMTIALLVAALALAALFYLREEKRVDTAERDAGLAASRVLTAVFEKRSRLEVARLSGRVLTRTEATSGPGGMFANVQTTRAPYEVAYTINLGAVGPRDYRWDAKRRVMFVTVPEVTVGAPSVDMGRAEVEQGGLYISRAAGRDMQHRAAVNLSTAAGEKARSPEHLRAARESARAAVARLVRQPLQAAGIGDVSVEVRLAGDPLPGSREEWDRSRSVTEVLGSPR